jgi:hypothetical protein
MGKGGSILGAGCCVPRVGTGDDGGGLLADGNPDVLAEGCLANAGACNDFSSRVHVGASLGSRGDVLGISSSIPGMTAVGDGSSLLVDSGVNTLGTGCGGSDVRPSADSILGSITIGVGMGLGMGSGGGSGDLNTGGGGSVRDTCGGVLHGPDLLLSPNKIRFRVCLILSLLSLYIEGGCQVWIIVEFSQA